MYIPTEKVEGTDLGTGLNWGKQLSRARSAHARWFPNADVTFMDASRRNAGYGMDGHVDMMRALSVPSVASG